MSDWVCYKDQHLCSSSFRAEARKRSGAYSYLHDEVGVTHATVDGELGESGATVLLHGVQDGLGLEAGSLEGGASNVTTLGVCRDTEDGTPRIVDPVRGEETAESGNECATAVVLDSLGEGAELRGRLHEAKIVHQELDTRSGYSNAALKGVHGLAGAKVESNGGEQTVRRNNGLRANVVQQEASSAVCVLRKTSSETLLADQSSGLVTQAASNLGTAQGGVGQGTVGLGIGRAHNLGQLDLLGVNSEPVNEVLIVLQGVDVHEHGTGGVGGIRDVDIARRAAVELVDQPGVDGTKSQNTALVSILDLGNVVNEPEKLADGGVCGKGKTASLGELAGPEAVLELADEVLGTGISPNNGVVQSLAGGLVPENGGLSLVGDADSLDLVARVALGLKSLHGAVNARLDRRDKLLGVVLVPAVAN